MPLENIRNLQLAELEILRQFIDICTENDLKYFAIGGTALGAARHRGFIPWDDDIDVSMPRSDYERFIELAPDVIREPFGLETVETTEGHVQFITKVVNRTYRLQIGGAAVTRLENSFMDVFTLDGLPDSRVLRTSRVLRFLAKKMLFSASVFDERVDVSRSRVWYERILVAIVGRIGIGRFLDMRRRALAADAVLSGTPFGTTNWATPQLWGQYRFKAVFPTEWFGEGTMLPFEDLEIRLPENYPAYLTQLYGENYMAIPHSRLRVSHADQIHSETA